MFKLWKTDKREPRSKGQNKMRKMLEKGKIEKESEQKGQVKGYLHIIEGALILVLILLLVANTIDFWRNFHNIDLVYNFNNLEHEVNQKFNGTLKLSDKASDFVERPLEDYWIISMTGLEEKFYLQMFYALALGLLLGRRL